MRRLSIYTLSAAAAMLVSTAMPVTSLAAVSTYRIPYSNNGMYILGAGAGDCLPGQLGQGGNWGQNGGGNQSGGWGQNGGWNQNGGWGQNGSGNQSGGWNQNDCWDQGNGWGAGPVLPDNCLPDVMPPEVIFPTPEQPELPDVPDGTLPDDPGTTPDVPDESVPVEPDNGGSQDSYAKEVVRLVNAERAKAGLSPLTINDGVAKAAQVRAHEIKDTFSHTRPDGSNFSTILTQNGITYRGVGENIAYGQNSPESVMQSWMNSSGHRANILNKDFTAIGVGHYKDGSGVDYWTQIFVK